MFWNLQWNGCLNNLIVCLKCIVNYWLGSFFACNYWPSSLVTTDRMLRTIYKWSNLGYLHPIASRSSRKCKVELPGNLFFCLLKLEHPAWILFKILFSYDFLLWSGFLQMYTKIFFACLIHGNILARLSAKLQHLKDQHDIINSCWHLESSALQFFAFRGWLHHWRLESI